MNSCEWEIGRLYCGEVRRFLDSEKFKGRNIDYLESKGWLSRTFTIKGKDPDFTIVAQAINSYFSDIKQAHKERERLKGE